MPNYGSFHFKGSMTTFTFFFSISQVETAEKVLARFNSLAEALKREYMFMFAVIQIVVIFSIYNALTGAAPSTGVHFLGGVTCSSLSSSRLLSYSPSTML
jgi:hypothetical protein